MVTTSALVVGLLPGVLPNSAQAAVGDFTITKLGWNVVGLDSNKVTTGPNRFPIGVRVCNTSGGTLSGTGEWFWLSSNSYVALVGSASRSWTLAASECRSIYWTIEVTRNRAAYDTTRNFRIDVVANGTTKSTAANQQVYVEKLVSQSRNATGTVTGPGIAPDTTPLYVGNTYDFVVTGSTATGGYQQLVFATLFDPSLFEIISVSQSYSANSAPLSRVPDPNLQVYADGCLWQNDYTIVSTYRTCLATGKVGSAMSSTYRVKVIGAGTSTLLTEIYDFSGSSYHYNADYGVGPTVTTTAAATYSLSVTKTASPNPLPPGATTITYTVSITNNTGQGVTTLSVLDSLAYTWSSAWPGNISNGNTVTRTGTYTVTGTDCDDGKIDNVVTATGKIGGSNARGQANATVMCSPAVSLTKGATPATFEVGDPISYTFTVANTGDVDLNSISIADDRLDAPATCLATTLASGASTTCSGTRVATQGDVDAGTIVNSATVTAFSTSGVRVTDTDSATVTGPTADPRLTIVKSTTATHFDIAGEIIPYRFTVTNTGNVTVSGISVVDAKLDSPAVCNATSLQPGQAAVCVGQHTVTAADVTAGSVANSATATGTPARGSLPSVTPSTTTVPKTTADLALIKAASPLSFAAVGDPVTYSLRVVNAGTGALTNVTVSDPLLGTLSCDRTLPVATLAAGAEIACTGVHTVTQADVDAGTITNTATASAIDASSTPITDTARAAVVGPAPSPALSIVKSTTADRYYAAGNVIPYTFLVTNTGNVTITAVAVEDTQLVTPATCPDTTLVPGQSTTCSGSYTVVSGDLTLSRIINTATATGTPDRGSLAPVTPSTVDVPRTTTPALGITKTPSPTSFSAVGDSISYTIVARNNGASALTSVDVFDALFADSAAGQQVNCSPALTVASLAAGASITCTETHAIDQADMDRGYLTNTAETVGISSSGSAVRNSATATIDGPTASPALTISKASTSTTFSTLGQVIPYTFTITNTGDVTITNVAVLDATLDDPATCDTTTLGPLDVANCTGDHTVTVADLLLDELINTATATGIPVRGTLGAVTPDTVILPKSSSTIQVEKSASPTTFTAAGETITYTALVTNTGTETLTSVSVNDPLVAMSCTPTAPTTLVADATMSCSGTYVTTQADVDAGQIDNTVTATGTDPSAATITDTDTFTVTGPDPAPELTVNKDASPLTFLVAGDTIAYTVVATNTGNVTLSDVTVTDPSLTLACTPTVPVATLAPGDSISCSGTYTATSADVTAGFHTNTAEASGEDPDGNPVTDGDSKTIPKFVYNPSLVLYKQAGQTDFTATGEVVDYEITVINNGDVSLTNVTVSDPLLTLSCTPSLPVASLASGASIDCTGSHTTVLADINRGFITNTASTSGTGPAAEVVSDSDSVTVNGPAQDPELTVDKVADRASFAAVGDIIGYTITVTNSGNVTLTNVTVSDPLFTVACSPLLPVASLAPGGTISCSGSHTVTQADVDSGAVDNTASASGRDPGNALITDTDAVSVTGPAASPSIRVTKLASPTSFTTVGTSISYTVTVVNNGNVTLSNVDVTDPKVTLVCSPTVPKSSLAPAATISCTGTRATTQADVDAGRVINTATATAEDPDGDPITDDDAFTVNGPSAAPVLTVEKSSLPTTFLTAGTALTYTVTARNTGNVTLASVSVTDTKAPLICLPTSPVASLAPSAVITCTGTYTTLAGDVTAGFVDNTASASATAPSGSPVTGTDSLRVSRGVVNPELSVVKSATPGSFGVVGDEIDYTITVTNTGNVPLTNVTVADPLVTLACTPSVPRASLAVSAVISCTGSRTVTQADIDAGSIMNTASAAGTDPSGDPVSATGARTVSGPAARPRLAVSKAASVSTVSAVGQQITYTVNVRNSGNVTITALNADDPMLGADLTCPRTRLAPAGSMRCTGTYTVTSADMARTRIVNTVTVTGTPARGTLAPATASARVTVGQPGAADLSISKSSLGTARVGETATFGITVANAGPDPARDVLVVDTLPPGLTATAAEGKGWTCTVSRTEVSCSLDRRLESGSSANVLFIKATVGGAAFPSARNKATVTSSTPDPSPGNNSVTCIQSVAKGTQEPKGGKIKVRERRDSLVISPPVSNAGQAISVKVLCVKVPNTRSRLPAADPDVCQVLTGPDGQVQVKATISGQVLVKVLYTAPATVDYQAFRRVDSFTLNKRLPDTT